MDKFYYVHVADLMVGQQFKLERNNEEYQLLEPPMVNQGIYELNCANLTLGVNEVVKVNPSFATDIIVEKLNSNWRQA